MLPARTSRPRGATHRTRPYHDTSRPSTHKKVAISCRYFLAGNCTAGDACRYRHDSASPTADFELDQQLQAFVGDSDVDGSQPAAETQPPGNDGKTLLASATSSPDIKTDQAESEELSDEEELLEIIPHPSAAVTELKYHLKANPGELRTYYLVQRQPVVEYEGNNVGVLSGGVLLGVPLACSAIVDQIGHETADDLEEPDMANSFSPSPISNSSDAELWKGPAQFEDADEERLVWGDEEFIDPQMETIEPSTCSYASPADIPPPPVIRRIMRRVDSHHRRHSLS